MKFFLKFFLISIVAMIILEAFCCTSINAQLPFIPNYYNYTYQPIMPYSSYYGFNYPFINAAPGWILNSAINPLISSSPWPTGYLGYNGYLGYPGYFANSFMDTFSMEVLSAYNYLNYAVEFYEIARTVPMLYMMDIQADQIGAMLYSYADSLDVSPQQAILHFIQQNYLQ